MSETPFRPDIAERIAAGIGALLCALPALHVAWVQKHDGFDALGALFGAVLATIAGVLWWYARRGHVAQSRARMKIAVISGFVLGAVGFVVGFVGALVFAAEANQGPLLGIFVTGPLGFVAGTLLGAVYAQFKLPAHR